MKGFLQALVSAVSMVAPQLSNMSNTSLPSLPEGHPASIQFSAWLTAFNTGVKETLIVYHSEAVFPYSVASRDIKGIDHEYGLAQASGGFDVVDVEPVSLPSVLTVVMKEKKRPIHAQVSIKVDVSKEGYPVTEFSIRPISTPLKFITDDDPRRESYEKALKPLDSSLRRKVVDSFARALKEEYVDPVEGAKLADIIMLHLEEGQYDSFEDSDLFAERLTKDLLDTGCGKYHSSPCLSPS